MDMLAVSDTAFFYSGDFDVNGLLIADRLKNRYGTRLHLWRMDTDSYRLSRSNIKISAERIHHLNHVKDKDLIATADCIKITGYAGYQELIYNLLLGDLILPQ
jgi:hypothetical protein